MAASDRVLRPHPAISAAALAFAAAVLGVPFCALVAGVVVEGPRDVVGALANEAVAGALARSLAVAAIAVVVNAGCGTACALFLVRGGRSFARLRRVLDLLVDLPLAVSPVMSGLAFLLLFGRDGLLAPLLDAAGVRVAFAFPGLVVATLFVTLPFCARDVAHLVAEVGDAEEQAAATLGASALRTFLFITLPNIAPALLSGVTLTAARALGEFGAVLVVGGAVAGRTDTATTFLYAAVEERNEPGVLGVALVLSAASMGLLAVLARFKRRGERT